MSSNRNILAYLTAKGSSLPSGEEGRLTSLVVNNGNRYVVSFNSTVNQQLIWFIPSLASSYQMSDLKLDLQCFMQSTTSNTVNMYAQLESITANSSTLDLEVNSDFKNSNTGSATSPSSIGALFTITIDFSNPGVTVNPNDMLRLKVWRNTTSATDQLLILGGVLYETPTNLDLTGFNATLAQNLNLGATTGSGLSASLTINHNGVVGNRQSNIDFISDDQGRPFSFRIIRDANGANGNSSLLHYGVGSLILNCLDHGSISLATNNTVYGTMLNNGYFGLQTNLPQAPLHVFGDIRLQAGKLDIQPGFSATGLLRSNPTQNLIEFGSVSAAPLVLNANNSERFRIDASGNIAIGNKNPTEMFHFFANDYSSGTGRMLMETFNGQLFGLRKYLAVDGDTLGGLGFETRGNSSINIPYVVGKITAVSVGNDSNTGCDLLFTTKADNSSLADVLRITHYGTLRLTPVSLNTSSEKTTGDLWIDGGQETVGTIVDSIQSNLVGCTYSNYAVGSDITTSGLSVINPNSKIGTIDIPPDFKSIYGKCLRLTAYGHAKLNSGSSFNIVIYTLISGLTCSASMTLPVSISNGTWEYVNHLNFIGGGNVNSFNRLIYGTNTTSSCVNGQLLNTSLNTVSNPQIQLSIVVSSNSSTYAIGCDFMTIEVLN